MTIAWGLMKLYYQVASLVSLGPFLPCFSSSANPSTWRLFLRNDSFSRCLDVPADKTSPGDDRHHKRPRDEY